MHFRSIEILGDLHHNVLSEKSSQTALDVIGFGGAFISDPNILLGPGNLCKYADP